MGDKDDSGSYRIISDRHAIVERRSPKPGRDYPTRPDELRRMTATPEETWRYLEKLRYPRGYFCPTCQLRRDPLRFAGTLSCPDCGHLQGVTDGTLLAATRGVGPSGWLRLLWDEAEGPFALGPNAVAITLGLPDPVLAISLIERLRAVEATLTGKRLTSACDLGLARIHVGGRTAARHEVWIAIVLEQASERVRLRRLASGRPSELRLALDDLVADDTPLLTRLPRVAAALEARSRPCELLDADAGKPPTRAVAEELAAWLSACPEASVDLIDGYLSAFAFRHDTRHDPPGARFYRLASAAMRFPPAQGEALGVVG